MHFMMCRVMNSNIEQPTYDPENALHVLDIVLMMQANSKLILQLSYCIMNAGSFHTAARGIIS